MKFKQFLETPNVNFSTDDARRTDSNYYFQMSNDNKEYSYGPLDRLPFTKDAFEIKGTYIDNDKKIEKIFKVDEQQRTNHSKKFLDFHIRNPEIKPIPFQKLAIGANNQQKQNLELTNHNINIHNKNNPNYYVGRLSTEQVSEALLMINDISLRNTKYNNNETVYRGKGLASSLYSTIISTKFGLISDSSLTKIKIKIGDKESLVGSEPMWNRLVTENNFVVYAINEFLLQNEKIKNANYEQLITLLKELTINPPKINTEEKLKEFLLPEPEPTKTEEKSIEIVTPENYNKFIKIIKSYNDKYDDDAKGHIRFLAVKK
jgi:hypothetical protein